MSESKTINVVVTSTPHENNTHSCDSEEISCGDGGEHYLYHNIIGNIYYTLV
jgi:hypothetical protein